MAVGAVLPVPFYLNCFMSASEASILSRHVVVPTLSTGLTRGSHGLNIQLDRMSQA